MPDSILVETQSVSGKLHKTVDLNQRHEVASKTKIVQFSLNRSVLMNIEH